MIKGRKTLLAKHKLGGILLIGPWIVYAFWRLGFDSNFVSVLGFQFFAFTSYFMMVSFAEAMEKS
jgi:hypothetical protein